MTNDSTQPPESGSASKLRRASFVFEATLDDVSRVAQALRIFTPDVISEDTRAEMEIGVVEALTNIVRHGYQNQGSGVVEVRYDVSAGGITVELKDSGKRIPEDFLKAAGEGVFDFDPQDIDQLPERGMGIALVHAAFDEIDYVSENGSNVLKMFKRVGNPTARP